MSKITRIGKLNTRINFIKKLKLKNDYGELVPTNQLMHSCWCTVRSQFLNEIQSNIGTILEDTITFIIRYYQPIQITNDMIIIYNNVEYKIIKINIDDGLKEYTTIIAKKVS